MCDRSLTVGARRVSDTTEQGGKRYATMITVMTANAERRIDGQFVHEFPLEMVVKAAYYSPTCSHPLYCSLSETRPSEGPCT